MKTFLPRRKKWLSTLAGLAACAAAANAQASSITFASFSDTTTGQWTYHNGVLTASAAAANFISFSGPNAILDYNGPVTYSLTATATAAPTDISGVISQSINGEMIFKHGSLTVLDVIFMGALVTGLDNSNSTSVPGDAQIMGESISYSSDPSIVVAPFLAPNSFSIALTQMPGISVSGVNLADFTASALGNFGTSASPGSGASPPTPLPRAAAAGPALLAGLLACRWLKRKVTA